MKTVIEILQQFGALRQQDAQPPNILNALVAIQSEVGWVPHEAVAIIAATGGLTEAAVAGVLSYYPVLRTRPPGRHVIRVCQGESCVANGGGRVLDEIVKYLGVGIGAITPDGQFTIETVYCIGCCGVSPNIMIGEHVHGRVTPSLIPELLKASS